MCAQNINLDSKILEQLLRTTHEGFWCIDTETVTLDVNPAMCEILGRSREEIIGRSIYDFVDDANAEVFRQEIAARRKGKKGTYEVALRRPDGSNVPCVNNATSVYDDEGRKLASIGLWTDISEIKETERALRTARDQLGHRVHERTRELAEANAALKSREGQLRLITDSLPVLITRLDREQRYIFVNKTATQWLNRSADQLLGRTLEEVLGEAGHKKLAPLAEGSLTGQTTRIEERVAYPDGITRDVDINFVPDITSDGGINGVFGLAVDVTELKQSEALLFDAVGTMSQGFALYDSDERLVICNQRFRETLPRIAALGLLVPGTTMEDMVRAGIKHGFVPSAYSSAEDYLTKRLEKFRHPAGPYEYITTAGQWIRVEEKRISNGGTVVIRTDITERKQLEEQVRRSQKMEAVGELTGGVAHDFNNILGIIMGFAQIVQDQVKEDPDLVQYLEIVLDGARRGADITKKLLGFSSEVPSNTELTAVNDFVVHMEELIATSLTPSINVETRLAVDLWSVEIDPGDLEDAILNLSLNARDAMPEGGTLVIESANMVLDENYARKNPPATAGDFVMISVSDTGAGMTDEIKEKLFEPFFTTKEVGQGTGLGLSMVYGFVKRSGGHITVDSVPGAGTTFRIYLPRAQAGSVTDAAPRRESELPGGTETVLVVDDEEGLLNAAVLHLEALGYKTLAANNGQQALDVLKYHQEIDLLFCDVVMPGDLDGYRVALAAHQKRPALKMLLTSGFTKKRDKYANGESRYLDSLASNLLSKPYSSEGLALAVRRTLDDGQVETKKPSMTVVDDDADIANFA